MASTNNKIVLRQKNDNIKVRSTFSIIRKLEDFENIDFSQLTDGATLVYDTNQGEWRATRNLNEQNIEGGEF
jgi:hypothetical protein